MDPLEKRLRIFYSKTGLIRFTSNLDVQRMWERTFRRAGIIISYSQGFHPQAKIQQASPLPLGFESDEEIVDIWVVEQQEASISEQILNSLLPDGIEITKIVPVLLQEKSLQPYLLSSDYSIYFDKENAKQVVASIYNAINSSENILFTKHNGKQYDLKPLIYSLDIDHNESNGWFLSMNLSSQINSTARPDHLLQYFGIDPAKVHIIRKKIHLKDHD